MAKKIPNDILDAMLQQCESTQIVVTSAEPANFAAVAGVTLATAVRSGSYTLANGPVTGRQNTCPAQTAVPITATGSATHVCITNATDTLYITTTCPTQALTSGGTVDLSTWAHILPDPT